MSLANTHPDPDDMFSDTRMSFGDHIEELRAHLLRAFYGFLFAMVFSLFLGRGVLYNVFIYPVEQQLQVFYDELARKRSNQALADIAEHPDLPANQPQIVVVQWNKAQLKAILEGKAPELAANPEELPEEEWVTVQQRIHEPVRFTLATSGAQRLLGPKPSMKTFNITEAFLVYFKISMGCGVLLASPWIFYQIWSFVAAGLYPNEKRYIHMYLPISLGLFLTGACVCQFIVLPKAVSALLWFNEWLNIEPDLRLNEWLGFAVAFPVFFGLSFQTPLVMMFLERIGMYSVEWYRAKRRMAFFVLAIVAAVGPSIDYFSMMFQWLALCLLYEAGILLCIWSPGRLPTGSDESDEEMLVEA